MGVALREGTVIARRFELDRMLGEGGMGEVWAARELENGQTRALKFLKGSSEERRRRFLREGRAAMTLRHPNVVTIHAVEEGEEPFLVMDLLEGETLRAHLDRNPRLGLTATLTLMMPVISAVGAAHAHGIVHRDLKPENVFLTPRDAGVDVRVLDFGVAKFAASLSTPALTESGDRLGTPRYMSPEQARGARDVDHRADIWSIGMMLYEALAGFHPIGGENVGAIFRAITFDPIPPLEGDCPADVRALVHRMLSREPSERPADLREVVAVLSLHHDGTVVVFDAPAIDEQRISRQSITTVDETLDGTTVPAQRRAGRSMLIVGVVIAIAISAATCAVVRRAASSEPRTSASPTTTRGTP
jgi:eukaryotic-like serine/threonine-protein kinase